MSAALPGRNDPCPCGSGRKFKHCCLDARTKEDAGRLRIRQAEGRVVTTLLDYVMKTWGVPFVREAWEEFFVWDDVPDDLPGTPEFDTMFVPWLTLGYIPDPYDDATQSHWPTAPVGLHWLASEDPDISDYDRAYVRAACASPMSAFVVESVTPGRSVGLKDILTGRRFHVLEQGASQTLCQHDLSFTRIVTVGETSVMFGATPFVIPAAWHTRIIDWRETMHSHRLMTRAELVERDIELRTLYLDIAAEILNPKPPHLSNTDGEPIEWHTLTYAVNGTVEDAVARLKPLARLTRDPDENADDLVEDEVRDSRGAVASVTMSWMKSGSKMHRSQPNTILGTFTVTPGQIVAEVNSARRATRLKREMAKRFADGARLVETKTLDVADALAERAAARASGMLEAEPEVQATPEVLALQDEWFRRHLEGWIGTKVPALGNKTPRQAARTAIGRERLAALLGDWEARADQLAPNGRQYLRDVRARLGVDRA